MKIGKNLQAKELTQIKKLKVIQHLINGQMTKKDFSIVIVQLK
jgi:hypothetical protein